MSRKGIKRTIGEAIFKKADEKNIVLMVYKMKLKRRHWRKEVDEKEDKGKRVKVKKVKLSV
jgi:hypothetical protein